MMAVWSIVSSSKMNSDLRFEAEYFQPKYLDLENRLSVLDCNRIEDISTSIRSGPFGSNLLKINYVNDGIIVLRPFNIKDATVENDNLVHISKEECEKNNLKLYKAGDLVFARVGDIRCGIIPDYGRHVTISPNIIAVQVDKKKINPYFLSIFMNTKLGLLQMERNIKVVAQPTITVETIKSILVPKISINEQNIFAGMFERSLQKRYESEALYAEAEALLLRELGLDSLDLSPQIAHTANFSEAMEARRLDAEYFQPKYYRVMDAIKALNPRQLVPLGDLLDKITNGHTPRHHDLSVGDIPFLTAEHVFDFRINFNSEKRILTEHHEKELKRTQLREGDILITIKGRIGNAAIVEHLPGPTNINQDVALLRLKSGYNSYYVVAFLNSLAGKALIDQICTGQINPFLGLGNLSQISIPIFDQGLMDELGEKIRHKISQAYQVKIDAELLLEEGKMRVEKIILNEV
jgi:restriction endonuclease S subunit